MNTATLPGNDESFVSCSHTTDWIITFLLSSVLTDAGLLEIETSVNELTIQTQIILRKISDRLSTSVSKNLKLTFGC